MKFSKIRRNYLVTRSLPSREGADSFFGLCPKNEPHSPFLRAKRAMG
ncbi:MAG: hypothetical protein U5L45_10390 [Saprospiraceae bacterium]|nr:hypothetical protein [Saprospiraceae bacterium]